MASLVSGMVLWTPWNTDIGHRNSHLWYKICLRNRPPFSAWWVPTDPVTLAQMPSCEVFPDFPRKTIPLSELSLLFAEALLKVSIHYVCHPCIVSEWMITSDIMGRSWSLRYSQLLLNQKACFMYAQPTDGPKVTSKWIHAWNVAKKLANFFF